MGVDIGNLPRGDPGAFHGQAHAPGCAASVSVGRREMDRIRVGRVADHLGQRLRAPSQGKVQVLQQQDSPSLGKHKAVAVGVKGSAGPLWLVIAPGDGAHPVECGHADRRHGGLDGAGKHSLGVAAADGLEGQAHRVGAGGTCRGHPHVGPLGAGAQGDLYRGGVDDDHGHQQGAHPARAVFPKVIQLVCIGGDAADARADGHAYVVSVVAVHAQARLGHDLFQGGDGKLGEPVGTAGILGGHVVQRVKTVRLAGKGNAKIGCVETGNGSYAGLAIDQVLPRGGHIQPQRRDGAHPGDDHTPAIHSRRFAPSS